MFSNWLRPTTSRIALSATALMVEFAGSPKSEVFSTLNRKAPASFTVQ